MTWTMYQPSSETCLPPRSPRRAAVVDGQRQAQAHGVRDTTIPMNPIIPLTDTTAPVTSAAVMRMLRLARSVSIPTNAPALLPMS